MPWRVTKYNPKTEKGKRFEAKIRLMFEYNGFHSKLNRLSKGQEDIVYVKDGVSYIAQIKNTAAGQRALGEYEIELLKKHADQFGMIAVYAYNDNRKDYIINLKTNEEMILEKPTTKWKKERAATFKIYKELKKKANTPKRKNEFAKFLCENFDTYKGVICR